MTKLAGILFFRLIINHNLLEQIKLVNTVHDEKVVEAIDTYEELAAKFVSESMETAGKNSL
jgi:DNA polymerase I-like protein with 3'-5' exonuclease and polymerase domains